MSMTITCSLASLMTVAVLAAPAFGAEKVGGTFRFAKAKVTLDVTGTSHGDMKLAGRVLLVKDAGGWKVSDRLLRVMF